MTSVQQTIDVEAPISVAYDQWTRFEEFPRFMGGVDEIVQTDDTHTHWTVSIAGIEREFDAVITEQHPDERVAWKSQEGEAHAGVVTFHRLDDAHTRVAVQLDWQPQGVVEKVGSLLQIDDVQITSDLKKFKEIVEQQGASAEGWRGDVPRDTDATGR